MIQRMGLTVSCLGYFSLVQFGPSVKLTTVPVSTKNIDFGYDKNLPNHLLSIAHRIAHLSALVESYLGCVDPSMFLYISLLFP